MKKTLITAITLLTCLYGVAQGQIAFPFQGGKDIMTQFFKDSLDVPPAVIQKKATGLVLVKFTADNKGGISKLIIYYAEDASLVAPAVEALQKSNHKWIIPDHEKYNDFILSLSFSFNKPPVVTAEIRKSVYDYNRNHKSILSIDQIPLNQATLLPTVIVTYDLPHL